MPTKREDYKHKIAQFIKEPVTTLNTSDTKTNLNKCFQNKLFSQEIFPVYTTQTQQIKLRPLINNKKATEISSGKHRRQLTQCSKLGNMRTTHAHIEGAEATTLPAQTHQVTQAGPIDIRTLSVTRAIRV